MVWNFGFDGHMFSRPFFNPNGFRSMMLQNWQYLSRQNLGYINFSSKNSIIPGSYMPFYTQSSQNYTPLFNFNLNQSTNTNWVHPSVLFGNSGSTNTSSFTFNLGSTNTTQTTLSDEVKTKIDDIRKLKFDNSELASKLDDIANSNDVTNYLTKIGQLSNTINTADGGKIEIYKDSNGNLIGSINKDKDGKIRNVSLDIADGGSISLNVDGNGKIENRYVMSKNNSQESNVGVTYDKLLENILKDNRGYTTQTEDRSNGQKLEIYMKDGKQIAYVLKDKDGKITSIDDLRETVGENETSLMTYQDINSDGKIDKGEGFIRYDKKV